MILQYEVGHNCFHSRNSFEYNSASSRGVESEIWTFLTGRGGFYRHGADNIYLSEIYTK